MSECVIVFLSSFVSVFALGFQSLNVNQGHRMAASLTSIAICTGTLFLLKSLPAAGFWPIASYYAGCNAGILSSMWFHPRFVAYLQRRKS